MGTANKSDDKIASYSSKGPSVVDHFVKPDMVAPGNIIASLRVAGSTLDMAASRQPCQPDSLRQSPRPRTPTYITMNGTSMATPVVAGAAALLIQQNPAITADQIKGRLMQTASKSFPDLFGGRGSHNRRFLPRLL